MKLDLLLRVATKILVPFIFLFSVYVVLHGDYGPGGGFQAGVAAAAMVILYAIIFGQRAAECAIPRRLAELMIPLGVLMFVGVGVASMLLGANFLNYSVLLPDQIHAQEWGILLVEIGVFITVAGTMTAIFYAIAGRERQ
jgi:multicomponent Na+:H+ antiporter subunit B